MLDETYNTLILNIYRWQAGIWAQLLSRKDRLPGALLIRGREGLGKLHLATALARSMLCESPRSDGAACGSCPACGWFGQGSHPDFRLLQPEALAEAGAEEGGAGEGREESRRKPRQQITIDQIRGLADFIGLSSHRAGRRVVLVHPAESMNSSAANALLKTLEEPPAATHFLLVSHRPQRLPATIRSRCVQVAMPVPDADEGRAFLDEEGYAEAADLLAEAGCAPLLARDFAEPGYRALRQAFLAALAAPLPLDAVALAERYQKADLPQVVAWLQKWCLDLLLLRAAGKLRYHPSHADALATLARDCSPLRVGSYLEALSQAQRLARHPLNPRLFLEDLLLSYRIAVA